MAGEYGQERGRYALGDQVGTIRAEIGEDGVLEGDAVLVSEAGETVGERYVVVRGGVLVYQAGAAAQPDAVGAEGDPGVSLAGPTSRAMAASRPPRSAGARRRRRRTPLARSRRTPGCTAGRSGPPARPERSSGPGLSGRRTPSRRYDDPPGRFRPGRAPDSRRGLRRRGRRPGPAAPGRGAHRPRRDRYRHVRAGVRWGGRRCRPRGRCGSTPRRAGSGPRAGCPDRRPGGRRTAMGNRPC